MALHCPATLLIAPAPRDAQGVAALAEALVGERVLAVVRSPLDRLGARLAEWLSVPVEDEPGLVGPVPSSSVLGEIGDLHRGETILVLVPGAAAGETPFVRRELG